MMDAPMSGATRQLTPAPSDPVIVPIPTIPSDWAIAVLGSVYSEATAFSAVGADVGVTLTEIGRASDAGQSSISAMPPS